MSGNIMVAKCSSGSVVTGAKVVLSGGGTAEAAPVTGAILYIGFFQPFSVDIKSVTGVNPVAYT